LAEEAVCIIQFDIQISVELVFFVSRVGGNRFADGVAWLPWCATGSSGDAGDRGNHILPVRKLSLQSRQGHRIDVSKQAITCRKGSERRGIALRSEVRRQEHRGERVGQRGTIGFAAALIGDKKPGTILHHRTAQGTAKLVAVVCGSWRALLV